VSFGWSRVGVDRREGEGERESIVLYSSLVND